jgi:non-specific serine/threonine protein kinase
MTKNLERELIAIIEPDGGYALDWQYLNKGLPEAAEEWQEEFNASYLADRDYAWWLLGVSKNDHDLSASMQYIYKVAATFVKNLIRTPGLELLREKAAVTLEDHDQEILLTEMPYLIGAEHLDRHWLECAWNTLHQVYEQEIKKHSGSINEYFRSLNPDIHVPGKVYFHLVESQREDYPFAFSYLCRRIPDQRCGQTPAFEKCA